MTKNLSILLELTEDYVEKSKHKFTVGNRLVGSIILAKVGGKPAFYPTRCIYCGSGALINFATFDEDIKKRQCQCHLQPDEWQNVVPLDWYDQIKYNNAHGRKTKEFTVTLLELEQIYIQQAGRCALSGLEVGFFDRININKNKPDLQIVTAAHSTSLDRIDSKLGYIPGNVQFLEHRINWMKGYLPEGVFVLLCNLVARHHRSRKFDDLLKEAILSDSNGEVEYANEDSLYSEQLVTQTI